MASNGAPKGDVFWAFGSFELVLEFRKELLASGDHDREKGLRFCGFCPTWPTAKISTSPP
jgi:hypothetical protein